MCSRSISGSDAVPSARTGDAVCAGHLHQRHDLVLQARAPPRAREPVDEDAVQAAPAPHQITSSSLSHEGLVHKCFGSRH